MTECRSPVLKRECTRWVSVEWLMEEAGDWISLRLCSSSAFSSSCTLSMADSATLPASLPKLPTSRLGKSSS